MMYSTRRFALLAGGVGAVGAGAGVWLLRAQGDGSLERIRRAGVLRVGYSVEAPFALVRPDGSISGQSPETVRVISRRLGLSRIAWVQAPFGDMIGQLLSRRIDMIGGLYITRDRSRWVRFSDPTVKVRRGLLVRRGNPAHLTSYGDAAKANGLRVAILRGSVEEGRLGALGLLPQETLLVPDAQTGLAAVARGDAYALALSLPTTRWNAGQRPHDFEALADELPAGQAAQEDLVAFAFHPDDAELQQGWNVAQAGWVGGPEHLATVRPFGFMPEDLATGLTATAVLAR